MPLYAIPEKDLREHCKRAVESLEMWMRRLIHQALSSTYGDNYLDATRPDGTRVIKAKITNSLKEKLEKEPARFSTLIDAALLEEEIALICNPLLYKEHFADALSEAFPGGLEEARIFLKRLVPIRNALSHANTISVHDAYRVLCYTHDVIHSLECHYRKMNMQQQYNAPSVIRIADSLGNAVVFSPANRHPDRGGAIDFSRDENVFLRCGDTLSIEVEVDPTYDPSTYEVEWQLSNIIGPIIRGNRFSLLLEERYVSTQFCVVCLVTSKAGWHRLGKHDDQIDFFYRVLPPV